MTVNVVGSLVLGILTGCSLVSRPGSAAIRHVAGVGLCGGYTTWSTASWESRPSGMRNGHRTEALVYTFGGLATCLATAALGIALAWLL